VDLRNLFSDTKYDSFLFLDYFILFYLLKYLLLHFYIDSYFHFFFFSFFFVLFYLLQDFLFIGMSLSDVEHQQFIKHGKVDQEFRVFFQKANKEQREVQIKFLSFV
jgi:hypothetical protein